MVATADVAEVVDAELEVFRSYYTILLIRHVLGNENYLHSIPGHTPAGIPLRPRFVETVMSTHNDTPGAGAPSISTIGIVGVGKLGSAIGQLAAAAGLEILATSRPGPMRDAIVATVLPTAQIVDFEELAARADVVVLAVPNTAVAELDLELVQGTLIDATNPWEATGTASTDSLSTAALAARFPQLHIAKTLNHVSYEELISDYRTPEDIEAGAPRRAIAVLAEDAQAREVAEALVERLGFEPVALPLSVAGLFQPEGDLFGVWFSAAQMREAVALHTEPNS